MPNFNLPEFPESLDEIIVLSEEQKSKIINAWRNSPQDSPPSLKDLIEVAFPNLGYDGRSKQGKAVRDCLASYNVFPKTNAHEKIGEYELSLAEKEFIQNNIDSMKPLEMAKTLWGPETGPLSRYFKALRKFINENIKYKPEIVDSSFEQNDPTSFIPPKTYTECLRLINKYNHDILSTSDISESQKQGIHTLIRYLHSPRFIKSVSTFRDQENRTLFLSEFIRATFDKPDLSVDELNLYISLAASYPLEQIALAEREALSQKLQEETENGKISSATVEAIDAKNDEYKDCQVRQEKLINTLNGSRAKRLDKQIAANTSILPLIKYWAEEKNRQNFIALAKIKEQARLNTTERLISVDNIIAEIYGNPE